MLNFEVTKPNVVASLITNVALLLIMLIGLFRLRLVTSGGALGRTLWNQVRWLYFSLDILPNLLM